MTLNDDREHAEQIMQSATDILQDGEVKALGFTTTDNRSSARGIYDASTDSIVPDMGGSAPDPKDFVAEEGEERFIELFDEGVKIGMLFIPREWDFEQTAAFAEEWQKNYKKANQTDVSNVIIPEEANLIVTDQPEESRLPDGLYKGEPFISHEEFAEQMAELLRSPAGERWLREHWSWNGNNWQPLMDEVRLAGQKITNVEPPDPEEEQYQPTVQSIEETYRAQSINPEEIVEEVAKKLSLPINAQKMNDGDMWMPPGTGNQPLYWLDGAWRSHEVYLDMLKEKEEAEKQPENDPVNHPSHYTAYPGIEIIQLTRWLGFNKGSAVKYIARAGLKSTDTKEQDLEKAIWYLKDELALLRGEYGVFKG